MTKEQQETKDKVISTTNFLRNQGYYVDNLWSIDDVLGFELRDGTTPNLDESDAMWVLDKVLTSEWIVEQIFVCIGEHIEMVLEENKLMEEKSSDKIEHSKYYYDKNRNK